MKKTILLFVAFLIGGFSYAQTARGFNYKAIVTNNGNPVANATINVKATIKNGSSIKWAETHSNVHTDANGIFAITIGEGTRTGGVGSFDEMDWNLPTLNMSVAVDAGSGYVNLVTNEYFKEVPFAKQAERLLPATYDVIVRNGATTHKGFRVDGTDGSIYAGYRINNGLDDWYIYMKNDKAWSLANDGTDVLTVSDTDNSVWIRGKLKASISGDADMKAYMYGIIDSNGVLKTEGSTNGFTITKVSTGNYKITFDTAFTHFYDYVLVANAHGAGKICSLNQASSYANIYVTNSSGAANDSYTTFIIYKK